MDGVTSNGGPRERGRPNSYKPFADNDLRRSIFFLLDTRRLCRYTISIRPTHQPGELQMFSDTNKYINKLNKQKEKQPKQDNTTSESAFDATLIPCSVRVKIRGRYVLMSPQEALELSAVLKKAADSAVATVVTIHRKQETNFS